MFYIWLPSEMWFCWKTTKLDFLTSPPADFWYVCNATMIADAIHPEDFPPRVGDICTHGSG